MEWTGMERKTSLFHGTDRKRLENGTILWNGTERNGPINLTISWNGRAEIEKPHYFMEWTKTDRNTIQFNSMMTTVCCA